MLWQSAECDERYIASLAVVSERAERQAHDGHDFVPS